MILKTGKTLNERPYVFIIRVKYVCAVLMHGNAVHIPGVHVSADMIPPVYHQYALARFMRLVREYRPEQTCADNKIIIFWHAALSFLWFTSRQGAIMRFGS